jgi:protocatechuate 3,4-dioxygenase beta subunit
MRTQLRLLVSLALISLGGALLIQAQEKAAARPESRCQYCVKTGTIRGRVTAADSGMGLGKASLVLFSADGRPRERPLTTKTNPTGEYEIRDVKPGQYHLRARRIGYVDQAYGMKDFENRVSQGTPLTVVAGETLSQVDFKLIRGGIIEGRVVDLDGEPMAHVEVVLERFVVQEGKRSLRPMGGGGTDDRGLFRIFGIAPGKYTVSALYRDWGREAHEESTYPRVYFPGTANPNEATRIDVTPGSQLSGIDIALAETKAFSVSGKVVGSDGKPAGDAMLESFRMDANGSWASFMTSSRGLVDADGTFRLGGLLPGRHRLTAESGLHGASLIVEIGSEDIRGVVLALGEEAEVSGRVTVEGEAVKPLPAMRVQLESAAGKVRRVGTPSSEVLEDQTFTIQRVLDGSYRFGIYPQLPNLYLKSARVQGKDALDQPFDVRNTEKVSGAEIILSADGGQITGVVKQEDSEELVKGDSVVLFSADAARQGPRSRWTRTTQSDQQGTFRLAALVPGEYMICAIQNHESGAESSPEYLQELAKHAKTLTVQAHGQHNESLVVRPAPAVE